MPRLKLEKWPAYQFENQVNIRVSDLNYGAHLANDRLISIIHQVRIEILQELGFSELDLGDSKSALIMSDLQVVYKSEAFLNEQLHIYSAFSSISKSSFRM